MLGKIFETGHFLELESALPHACSSAGSVTVSCNGHCYDIGFQLLQYEDGEVTTIPGYVQGNGNEKSMKFAPEVRRHFISAASNSL